jgi:NAD(P)H-hydrate epimerase
LRLATAEQAQQIDQQAQSEYSISAETLMEAAGTLAAREIEQLYFSELARGEALVICGPGNNGGDGMVVARHLQSRGRRVRVLLADEPKSPLLRLQWNRLRNIDVPLASENFDLNETTLIVDAMFGIGLSKTVGNPWSRWIKAINESKKTVVSLDTPSGLNVDTGQVEGAVVHADTTLTFGLAKPGFFMADGPQCVGRLRILNIGFPKVLVEKLAATVSLFTEREAAQALPGRADQTHKGSHGHVAVIAGQPGFWGAGVLASHAAFRIGAGYVTWASHTNPVDQVQQVPECLMAQLDADFFAKKWTAIAIGPGLGVTEATARAIDRLKSMPQVPVVIDADGIMAAHQYGLLPLPAYWVATPHPGELARVLETTTEALNANRILAARAAHERLGCVVVFKGFRTVIDDGERTVLIPVGNSALAKAGTGDVLTGMIAGLLAQGVLPRSAAATGAYLHGRIADEFQTQGGDKISLMASDLYKLLPEILANLRAYGIG